jgi:hypothetical protein
MGKQNGARCHSAQIGAKKEKPPRRKTTPQKSHHRHLRQGRRGATQPRSVNPATQNGAVGRFVTKSNVSRQRTPHEDTLTPLTRVELSRFAAGLRGRFWPGRG